MEFNPAGWNSLSGDTELVLSGDENHDLLG